MNRYKRNDIMQRTTNTCDRCGGTGSEEAHGCPYSHDIEGDGDFLCTCCPDCFNQCSWEI